jgi:signal transduction histidine kinase
LADQQFVERLARHAAIAIETNRLYEENQQLAIVEERARFAHDLHDSIIQSIYGVGFLLDQVKAQMPNEPQATQPLIDQSLQRLAGVIEELRNYIFDLRPQALGYQDLMIRLAGLMKEVQMNTRLPIEVKLDADLNTLFTQTQARHLFHISHEALANIFRHAKATPIRFSLGYEAGQVHLHIEDDGLGFVPQTILRPVITGWRTYKPGPSSWGRFTS